MLEEQNDLRKPLLDIFPESWHDCINNYDNLEFRNLAHFKHSVSQLRQKKDDHCGVTYEQALKDLLQSNCNTDFSKYTSIKNLVRSNLFKRGLITEEVYENFKYSDSGTQVGIDVAKYAAGDPNCVITPSKEYVNFFYELYISISYPYQVTNSFVMENVVKLLATIEELERQKIFIKVVLVFPARGVSYKDDENIDFFLSIPLFSHNEVKTAESMCSVINDRLLRKFCFAILEDIYKDYLDYGYGTAVTLPNCMNIGTAFNEIEFFETVKNAVGA